MTYFSPRVVTAFVILVAGLASCSQPKPAPSPERARATQPAAADEPATQPAPSEDNMAPPFMFKEAALPEGFPPPAPVGQIVVKSYPAHRLARVEAGEGVGENAMFRTLFNHIKRNQISMTAPVEMAYVTQPGDTSAKPTSMAFMYASRGVGQPGRDGQVEVIDVPEMTVVSLALRGSYKPDRYEAAVKQLRAWLAENAATYTAAGEPRYLGYNSPFVPGPLRMGEVQVPVLNKTAVKP